MLSRSVSSITACPTTIDPESDDGSSATTFTPEPETLWRRVLERKGPRYAMLARVPFDPSTN